MTRRMLSRLSAKTLFNEVTFSSLDLPHKSIRLERDSLQDYCQRPTSAIASIAELYHENTKLFPQMLGDLACTRVDLDEVRREFLKRRSLSLACPERALTDKYRDLLNALVSSTPSELFYAVELRIAFPSSLVTHEPISGKVYILKEFTPSQWAKLLQAVRLLPTKGRSESSPTGVLLLVCNFARNDLLFGPRAYRRTLIEAGRILQLILEAAEQLCIKTGPRAEFADREIDALIEADGVEEGAVLAIELGE